MEKFLKRLCSPAYFYFVISMFSLVVMSLQNLGNTKTYCVGSYNCPVESVGMVFIIKALYVILWTWILNKLCSIGYKNISWFLVLFPFILMFVLIAMFILVQV